MRSFWENNSFLVTFLVLIIVGALIVFIQLVLFSSENNQINNTQNPITTNFRINAENELRSVTEFEADVEDGSVIILENFTAEEYNQILEERVIKDESGEVIKQIESNDIISPSWEMLQRDVYSENAGALN